jgi:hypothetical protein
MKYSFILMMILATLAGCTEEPPEEYDRVVFSTLLNATWRSECVVDGTNSYIPTLVFNMDGSSSYDTGTGSSSRIYHTDNTTCSSLEPEVIDLATFSYTLGNIIALDGAVAEITEAIQIDTVNTTEGSTDIGATEFDIYAVKDRLTLYFGNKEAPYDGTTAELRPIQLTDSVIYYR